MREQMPPEAAAAHWRATRRLMWFCLLIWLIFSFAIHFFVDYLDQLLSGPPLGFYMAAQGSLIVFVVLIFFYSSQQSAIDEKYNAEED